MHHQDKTCVDLHSGASILKNKAVHINSTTESTWTHIAMNKRDKMVLCACDVIAIWCNCATDANMVSCTWCHHITCIWCYGYCAVV